MGRLRTLKPEFFTHELLCELSPLHRILYEGTWCHADREGRLEDRPRYLKTVILPYDAADVDAMLDDLAARGFIVRYVVDGRRYLFIPAFLRHQKPHPKEKPSSLPPPPIGAATNGPRLDTPAQGVAITMGGTEPGKDQTNPRKGTVEPGKDLVEPGGLGGFCLGDLGLGDLGLGGFGLGTSPRAAVVFQMPEPEDFEPDAAGCFRETAWGFWGWHNQERQRHSAYNETSPPDWKAFQAWHDKAALEVGASGLQQAYELYLGDEDFASGGWSISVFMRSTVWEARASARAPKRASR